MTVGMWPIAPVTAKNIWYKSLSQSVAKSVGQSVSQSARQGRIRGVVLVDLPVREHCKSTHNFEG